MILMARINHGGPVCASFQGSFTILPAAQYYKSADMMPTFLVNRICGSSPFYIALTFHYY